MLFLGRSRAILLPCRLHVGLVLGVVAWLRNWDFSVGVVVGLLFHCSWTTHLKRCTIEHGDCWAEAATAFQPDVWCVCFVKWLSVRGGISRADMLCWSWSCCCNVERLILKLAWLCSRIGNVEWATPMGHSPLQKVPSISKTCKLLSYMCTSFYSLFWVSYASQILPRYAGYFPDVGTFIFLGWLLPVLIAACFNYVELY